MRSTFIKWLFIAYLLGSGTLYSIVILVLFTFVGRSGRYWLAVQWCRATAVVMRWLPGITCSVEGLEYFPEGPSIILCRHESTWETLAFLALFPRRISFVFKDDLLRIPIFGWVLRGLDVVRLNRGSPRQVYRAVTRQFAERLAKGEVVVIFPEGARVSHGAPFRLTSGGIRLACATGVPVVPVVHNAGKVWPAKGWPDGAHRGNRWSRILIPRHVATGIGQHSSRLDEVSIADTLTAAVSAMHLRRTGKRTCGLLALPGGEDACARRRADSADRGRLQCAEIRVIVLFMRNLAVIA